MLARLHRFNKNMASQEGSVAVLIAVVMIAVIGFAALGTEVVFLLVKHRHMQSAADAAAFGGAIALGTGSPSDLTVEAQAAASEAGFTNGLNGTVVAVNHPPLSGSHIGDAASVEVVIKQPQAVSLMQLFQFSSVDVRARAVAQVGGSGLYCVLALDPTAFGAIALYNNTAIINSTCGVGVNSSSSSALFMTNNALINGPVSVHGGWTLYNHASLNGSPNVQQAPVLADPYANVQVQSAGSCTAQTGNIYGSQVVTFIPGIFAAASSFPTVPSSR